MVGGTEKTHIFKFSNKFLFIVIELKYSIIILSIIFLYVFVSVICFCT